MKTMHTPGPWEVNSGMIQTVREHACKTPRCGVHIPIARMDREPNNGTLPIERDANAHLIAAAPDLLEACQRAFRLIKESGFSSGLIEEEFDSTLRQLAQAIANSLGGSE